MYSKRNQTVHNEADNGSEAYLLQSFLILFRKSAGSNHDIQLEPSQAAFHIVTAFDRAESRVQGTLVFETSLEELSDTLYVPVEIPSLYLR